MLDYSRRVRTSFQLHFDDVLGVVDQCGKCLESSVEWLDVLKRLSTERVAKARAVVDLDNFSALVQPKTTTKNKCFLPLQSTRTCHAAILAIRSVHVQRHSVSKCQI